ncbi:MAG: sialidase family protein [Agriterribacter sp.]
MVFESGKEGHNTYRIPAVIQTASKRLLAFCEGRVDGGGDFGNIDIVMKYSDDKGKTWSVLKTIVDMDSLQAGNPAPVVDLTDPAYPAGRIFLFYNTGNNHENEVRKGRGLREAWYKTSTDNGITWSEPVNITTQVHRPNQPQVSAAYHFPEDWRSYANTPGHAVQFDKGKYKGRIFVAANHSTGNPQPKFADYSAHGFYTDDHGKTFKLSTPVNIPGSNESTAALLGNDVLIMNSRNQHGDIKRRIVSYSSTGGASWDTSYFDYSLPDPVNEGSILTIKNNTIAFCNAADTAKRDNLTLRISKDGGRKWSKAYTVDKSAIGYEGDFIAYADLVKISGTNIGVLYERDDYKEIVFKVVEIR